MASSARDDDVAGVFHDHRDVTRMDVRRLYRLSEMIRVRMFPTVRETQEDVASDGLNPGRMPAAGI